MKYLKIIWHHFFSKIVLIQTFYYTKWCSVIRVMWQIFTT